VEVEEVYIYLKRRWPRKGYVELAAIQDVVSMVPTTLQGAVMVSRLRAGVRSRPRGERNEVGQTNVLDMPRYGLGVILGSAVAVLLLRGLGICPVYMVRGGEVDDP